MHEKKLIDELVKAGVYQRWKLFGEFKSYLVENDEYEVFLQFSDQGFVSGVAVHDFNDEDKIDIVLDVFGNWSSEGIQLKAVGKTGDRENIRTYNAKWSSNDEHKKAEGTYTHVGFNIHEGNVMISKRCKFYMIQEDEDASDSPPEAKLSAFLRNLQIYFTNSPEQQHFYDYKIICSDGIEVKSHKIILASQTKYFEGLFRQEASSNSVKLDLPGESVKSCVKYLYTGDVDINGDNVQDILVAANYMFLKEVVSLCTKFVKKNMNLNNCVEIYHLADSYSLEDLVHSSLKIISVNFQKIFKTDEQIQSIPEKLFEVLLQREDLCIYDRFGIRQPDDVAETILENIISKHIAFDLLIQTLKAKEKRNKFSFKWSDIFGSPRDNPRKLSDFNISGCGDKVMRKISVLTDVWDGRTVVSGLKIVWSDESEDMVGGGDVAAEHIVPEGDHISFVVGNRGWYIDNLSFICSSGKEFGPVGGDGGAFYNTNPGVIHYQPSCIIKNNFVDGIKV